MDYEKATEELRKPLMRENVKPAKQYGPKGEYIEAWHAIEEANDIFGFFEWSYEVSRLECVSDKPRPIGRDKKDGFGVSYLCMVTVTVGNVTRQDTGSGHGYDLDQGLAHESASKEAVSDALKRALKSFGNRFGLALYDKSKANVADTPPPDCDAILERIKKAIAKVENVEELRELKSREGEALQTLKDIAPAMFTQCKNAFMSRSQEFLPPPPDDVPEIPAEAMQ